MGLESDVAKIMKRLSDVEKDLEQLRKDHDTFGKWVQKEFLGANNTVDNVETRIKSLEKTVGKG